MVNKNDKKYAFILCNSNIEGNVNDSWLFDSGATNHMVNNLKRFTDIDFQEGELCQAGAGSRLRYEGVGTVEIKITNENEDDITIMMSDVLYVPQLRENLLSTTTLMKKGYKIVQQYDTVV